VVLPQLFKISSGGMLKVLTQTGRGAGAGRQYF